MPHLGKAVLFPGNPMIKVGLVEGAGSVRPADPGEERSDPIALDDRVIKRSDHSRLPFPCRLPSSRSLA